MEELLLKQHHWNSTRLKEYINGQFHQVSLEMLMLGSIMLSAVSGLGHGDENAKLQAGPEIPDPVNRDVVQSENAE